MSHADLVFELSKMKKRLLLYLQPVFKLKVNIKEADGEEGGWGGTVMYCYFNRGTHPSTVYLNYFCCVFY